MKVLVTGGAGFIGSNLIDNLLRYKKDAQITCLDNFDPFYNPKTKRNNIKNHLKNPNYTFVQGDIRNLTPFKSKLLKKYDAIVHLAGKAGIIPSIQNPALYNDVNIFGTQSLLELARQTKCQKFIFASSSSVYGVCPNLPWNENENLLKPISPYASTKISCELLGHVYSHLYNFQFISLRLFTVYGPRQRPDLAIHKFTKLILEGKPINIYGNGKTKRDYTYINDIISGIVSSINYSKSNYEIINLGNNHPITLLELVKSLEKILNKKAKLNILKEQPGDAPITYADITKAKRLLNFQPKTSIIDGLELFINWYKNQNEKI